MYNPLVVCYTSHLFIDDTPVYSIILVSGKFYTLLLNLDIVRNNLWSTIHGTCGSKFPKLVKLLWRGRRVLEAGEYSREGFEKYRRHTSFFVPSVGSLGQRHVRVVNP